MEKKKVRITSGIFWTLMGKNLIMEKSDAGAACLSWTFFFSIILSVTICPNFLNRCCERVALWDIQDIQMHFSSSPSVPWSSRNLGWRPLQALPNCNSLRCWGPASQTFVPPSRPYFYRSIGHFESNYTELGTTCSPRTASMATKGYVFWCLLPR